MISSPNGRNREATKATMRGCSSRGVATAVGTPIWADVTNATTTKIAVAVVKTIQFARGMLWPGSFVSSPVCAMISYPSNTMNVNPIAMRIDSAFSPRVSYRKNGSRFDVGRSWVRNQATPARAYVMTIARSAKVTMTLNRPVVRVPR